MKKILLASLALILSVGMAQAQPQRGHRQGRIHKNIHVTQKQQQKRIAQGIHSGKITPVEGAHLERQQARIQRQKRMVRADGRVTPQERMRIKKHQRMASRQIYMKKHNRQKWQ